MIFAAIGGMHNMSIFDPTTLSDRNRCFHRSEVGIPFKLHMADIGICSCINNFAERLAPRLLFRHITCAFS